MIITQQKEECLVMLLEPKNTLHTGDIVDKKTKSISEQLTSL